MNMFIIFLAVLVIAIVLLILSYNNIAKNIPIFDEAHNRFVFVFACVVIAVFLVLAILVLNLHLWW